MNKERGGYSDLQPFLCLDRGEHYNIPSFLEMIKRIVDEMNNGNEDPD